jgi:hypothetical protein
MVSVKILSDPGRREARSPGKPVVQKVITPAVVAVPVQEASRFIIYHFPFGLPLPPFSFLMGFGYIMRLY